MAPTNIDLDFFEKVVLYNTLLGDHKELYMPLVIDYLNPNVIKDKGHRMVAEIIHNVYERTDKVPSINELKVFLNSSDKKEALIDTLTSFKSLDTKWDNGELIANTENFLKQRMVQNVLDEAWDLDGKIEPDKLLEETENAVNICLTQDLGIDLLNQMDWFAEGLLKVSAVHSTGYPWLDRYIQGGFVSNEGALYMFGGATNVGKSNLLANLAVNMLEQNLKCLIISLEMSELVYSKRIMSMLTSVYLDKMPDEYDRVAEFVGNFKEQNSNSQLFIKQFPTSMVHYKHVDGYIKKLERSKGFNPDVYFIDYPGIMLPFRRTGKTDTDIKRAHEEVRALSVMYKKPFISVLQLNKDAFDIEKPDLKTTGGSIGISQTSDFQANLFATEDDVETGHIGMSIQKSRFGPNKKTTKFAISSDTLRIKECDITDTDYDDDLGLDFDDVVNSIDKKDGETEFDL